MEVDPVGISEDGEDDGTKGEGGDMPLAQADPGREPIHGHSRNFA